MSQKTESKQTSKDSNFMPVSTLRKSPKIERAGRALIYSPLSPDNLTSLYMACPYPIHT